MKSHTTERFRRALQDLSTDARRNAREAYRLFVQNPNHPGLRFKKVHPTRPIYSVRIDLNHRAVGLVEGDAIIWFWIGSHGEYERLLRNL